MSSPLRFDLCACTSSALGTFIREFERQGFYDLEARIDDKGRIIISGCQVAPPTRDKKPRISNKKSV